MKKTIIKYLAMAWFLLICVWSIYYCQIVLDIDRVFTHVFYVPIILAGFWWGMRAVWISLILGVFLVGFGYFQGVTDSLVYNILRSVMFIVVSLVVGLLRDRDIINEIKLSSLSRKLLTIREDEKRQLSANLHDELGAMSVGLSSILHVALTKLRKNNIEEAGRDIEQAKIELENSIENLKKMAVKIRPSNLDFANFEETLKEYFSNMLAKCGVNVNFNINIKGEAVNEDIKIALFRIIQESINNVVEHARATIININISTGNDSIKFDIIDNGKGFDVGKVLNSKYTGFGILGMRERAESLGGEYFIESAVGKGTTVKVEIPIKD